MWKPALHAFISLTRKLVSTLFIAAIMAGPSSAAIIWSEVGDAGQSQATVQGTGTFGVVLSDIFGSLLSPTDADLYLINILEPAAFSATTVNATGGFLDTQLFLLTASGAPIYLNDDDPGGLSTLSTLPAGHALRPPTAGTYLLGIAMSGYDPVNIFNQLLFASGLSTDVRGRAAGLQPGVLGGFFDSTFGADGGRYDIQLTGALTAPEPGTAALVLLAGALAVFAGRKRPRRTGRSLRSAAAMGALLIGVCAVLAGAGPVHAGPVPANLGAGLYDVAVGRYVADNPASTLAQQQQQQASFKIDAMTIGTDGMMRDESDRVLVDIVLDGRSAYDDVRAAVSAMPGVAITAEDRQYRSGILEGYVPEDTLVTLASIRGVSAVHAVHLPTTNVGSVTQQGLVQHRIDQLPASLNGAGITIGVLSDSYNTARNFAGTTTPLTIREAQDIASCDLPGTGNPCGNTQPVVMFEDFGTFPNAQAIDEGRGMAQLIHDMAPQARIGFATAFLGDVSMANNIRALAGIPTAPNFRPGFAAQIIVDDVQYFAEGMFADTVIAQAVDDVTALGVSYFSSAGNTPPTQGYGSDLRLVPVGPGATAGTNINLTGIPAAFYAGGFHNFRSDGGQDIAQTLNLGSVAARQLRMVMQWDDPYDPGSATGPVLFQQSAALTPTVSQVDIVWPGVIGGGKAYQIDVSGNSVFNGPGNFDAIVTIINPDGSILVNARDTGSFENFPIFAQQSGDYTIRVTGFENDQGTFTVTVNESTAQPITTDLNLLFFRVDNGAFLGCVCENNFATNRPVELPSTLTFPSSITTGQVQLVIARANLPTAPLPASRLRYMMLTSSNGTIGSVAEYFSYSTPITYGHNSAAGANNVAAYSPFRPNIPEDFSSPGPVRIVWDRNSRRIPDDQQIRLKPDMAAMDGGNTTFFTADTGRDLDTFPNFFGTSASAPNAASVAVLVLQAKGGPGSVTPAQMRTMLRNSAWPHDLDPYSARAQAIALPNRGKVTVTLDGDNSTVGRTDPNAFTLSYVGPSYISSITFDATNANPGGGNVVVGSTPGLVFDTRATAGQPFVVGPRSVGLTAANVTATNLAPAPAPAVAGQNFGLKLDFAASAFTGGKALRFGVGRAFFRSAFVPPAGDSRAANSADLAGADVLLPSGTIATGGITFSGTLGDGSTFAGVMANRIGAGYSFLDGFGFVDAVSAVNQPLP